MWASVLGIMGGRVTKGRGLHRRLYDALRGAILSGRLAPGSRLPPTRVLAEDLGMARQTVVLVYERLAAEGYVGGRVGAGTFVSGALQGSLLQGNVPPEAVAATASLPHSDWSARATPVPWESGGPGRQPLVYDFRPGVPDWEAFPHTRWRRLLTRTWRRAGTLPALGRYGDPAGYRPLREALASYLASSRGLRCTADQVVIVSGSQQALDLVARVCLDPGDVAAVESPGYPDARSILAACGARLLPVPVDEAGMAVPRSWFLIPRWPNGEPGAQRRVARGPLVNGQELPSVPRLVYVTPSHQYPTGVTMSLRRRLELLEWAARAGALIIEDDYDSELRYAGRPLPALQGLDERGCVAYVGSCSTVLFPPLRVGWIVAPLALVAPLTAAKWLADRQTSTLDQLVLADFIASGEFARHLRRSRRLYGARRAALVAAVERHLGGRGGGPALSWGAASALHGEPAGLQTLLYLPPSVAEAAVVAAAASRGVGVYPLGPCFGLPRGTDVHNALGIAGGAPVEDRHVRGGQAGGRPPAWPVRRPGLLLGFAALPEAAIDTGVGRLGQALREVAAAGAVLFHPSA